MAKTMSLRLPEEKAAELTAIARDDQASVSKTILEAIDGLIDERRKDKDFQERLEHRIFSATRLHSTSGLGSSKLALMDMSGAMPRAAWLEIRGPSGELLESVPGEISGGGIQAWLPAFEPGALGSVVLCLRWADGSVSRDTGEVAPLPTTAALQIHQIG